MKPVLLVYVTLNNVCFSACIYYDQVNMKWYGSILDKSHTVLLDWFCVYFGCSTQEWGTRTQLEEMSEFKYINRYSL